MKKRLIALFIAGGLSIAAAGVLSRPTAGLANAPQRAATGQFKQARIDTGNGIRLLPTLSGGVIDTASSTQSSSGPSSAQPQAPSAGSAPPGVTPGSQGCSTRNQGGAAFGNVRVNQDCTYRLQAEEGIKFNPANPNNLIAGMNDERQGYNLMAFAYSFDSGKTWGDGPPPFYQKVNDPFQELATAADPNNHTVGGDHGNLFTYDGGSDPILTFDRSGRAFFGGVIFDRVAGLGSAIAVTVSPAGAGGTFYYTPLTFSRHFIITEDNSIHIFHDKPFIAADTGPHSPNRDNVYVTWTVFKMDDLGNYLQSPIYGSMSTDHGLTWSTPEEISGTSSTLCFFGDAFTGNPGDANHCNFDQGSDPMVLPNGDLEVIYNNGNTPAGNPNGQQLGVHCKPSGSSPAGTAHLNCQAPTKVGNDVITGEPQCAGVGQCIPGSFVRTDDFPRIAMNQGNGNLYATWQDYRAGEYDIQLSRSTDGGATWTEATSPVNKDKGIDHYEAAIDVVCNGTLAKNNPACVSGGESSGGSSGVSSGNTSNSSSSSGDDRLCGTTSTQTGAGTDEGADHVVISYYRTCRVPNENAGGSLQPPQSGVQTSNSDYSLVSGFGLHTAYGGHPISPVFPPPNGTRQTGFMGDYSGITLVGAVAHPIWADPRNSVAAQFRDPDQPVFNDEDIFTVAETVPGST